MSLETDLAELMELGASVTFQTYTREGGIRSPWTSVRMPKGFKGKDQPTEYADTTPHAKAVAEILALVKSDLADGSLA